MDKNGYNPSIMQDKEECFITHSTTNLIRHEIYYGTANREISKKNGFWVWLIPEYHNTSNKGVHCGNKELDLYLKRTCQEKFERLHSRKEFIALIGKNYI